MSNENYSLVMSFPDQSPSFAHGFTCGRIWHAMTESPACDVVEEMVDADCRPTIEAMAMAKGWIEEIAEINDGWISVRLRSPDPEPASPVAL